MRIAKRTEVALRAITYAVLALLYTPLALIFLLSFNAGNSLTWPPQAWSLHWWGTILDVASARQALVSSVRLAALAMLIALVLGSLLAFALQGYDFFGKSSLSFLAVLPIALPGIVTGVALRNTFVRFGWDLGFVGCCWACHILHCCGLQQYCRSAAADCAKLAGGFGGSGCRRGADFMAHHLAVGAVRSLCWWYFGFCAELRRGCRDDIYGGRRNSNPAAMDSK